MEDSKKLKGKDLINIGIFTAIYFVVTLVFAMLGFIPVFMPLMAVFDPLFGGIVFMLFLTKVKKPGMILIMSILMGILMWLTGMSFYALVVGIVTGLIAELIYKSGDYKSSKKAVFTHAVFCLWIWSNYLPLFLQPEKYWQALEHIPELRLCSLHRKHFQLPHQLQLSADPQEEVRPLVCKKFSVIESALELKSDLSSSFLLPRAAALGELPART